MNESPNEPAFPVSTGNHLEGHKDHPGTWQFPGMSLRDYFAAKAMQEAMSWEEMDGDEERVARAAYRQADAMLKVRGQPR